VYHQNKKKGTKGVKRKAEETQGVTPDAKKQKTETSSTAEAKRIVCRNFDFGTTEEDIKDLFKDYEIGEIKMIQRNGKFAGFAFIDIPSQESFDNCLTLSGAEVKGRQITIEPARERQQPQKHEHTPSEKPEGCDTIFIGNLSFQIKDENVKEFFKDCGEVAAIRWLNHRDTGKFKGIGFVQFSSTDGPEKAIVKNGQDLLGRPIRIDYAKS